MGDTIGKRNKKSFSAKLQQNPGMFTLKRPSIPSIPSIPCLSVWESGEENLYLDNWYQCGFSEFNGDPQPGDLIIMQVQAPAANHEGVLLADNMLLHHMYGMLSQRVPCGGYWRDRTVKVVRHKDTFR